MTKEQFCYTYDIFKLCMETPDVSYGDMILALSSVINDFIAAGAIDVGEVRIKLETEFDKIVSSFSKDVLPKCADCDVQSECPWSILKKI